MGSEEFLWVVGGALLVGTAALLFMVGHMWVRIRRSMREKLLLRNERNAAIEEALSDPTSDNVERMWKSVNDYDRERHPWT